jgi:hypothetical protein
LFSIGFHGAPKRLGQGPFVAEEISTEAGMDVAEAIDRLEHGGGGDDRRS